MDSNINSCSERIILMVSSVAEIFGIETITPEYYKHALTHSSFTKEKNLPYTQCYERLEFLGDAVLKLTISDVLFKMYPDYQEGELSKIRSIIVSDNTLADIARKNGLQDLIIMSKHEEKQGCRKLNSICACAFEATLGAYYLDGKYNELEKYIETTFKPYIIDVKDHFEKFNAKAVLQEYTQGKTKNTPIYTVIREIGPEHKKEFEIEVKYNNEVLAIEKGLTKKEAEQKCAYSACKKLGII
ncbi:TPA: ribonuclease III [Candidatus Gastranaerophilales bacterium HUM_6]|nr:MAG TPA: ribonuclease III [Candidatus Gastranaerophilales bacterium HUM_6]DAA96171.1 MAG TPA: ribonuclease III [Candidatus Gastranaerophilales bacterium HUM_7]DAB08030.1 MAG TPA: ribonuclease III [Candidatus Gastranaerophilales bacterium HUM_14]